MRGLRIRVTDVLDLLASRLTAAQVIEDCLTSSWSAKHGVAPVAELLGDRRVCAAPCIVKSCRSLKSPF